MERHNCLMICFLIILGTFFIISGAYSWYSVVSLLYSLLCSSYIFGAFLNSLYLVLSLSCSVLKTSYSVLKSSYAVDTCLHSIWYVLHCIRCLFRYTWCYHHHVQWLFRPVLLHCIRRILLYVRCILRDNRCFCCWLVRCLVFHYIVFGVFSCMVFTEPVHLVIK